MRNDLGHKNFFHSKDLQKTIKVNSIKGGMNTIGAEGVIFVLRLGSIAILARILMPEHFGLISMVTALTAIAEQFKDFGLSIATVQAKEITHNQVSNLFWINTLFGFLIMILICFCSNLIAGFYNDTRLLWITIAISTNYFWGGLTVQHQALLRRRMLYTRIAVLRVVVEVLCTFLAVVFALKGFEYWALVWREVARAFLQCIGTWALCRWIPGLPDKKARIGKLIRFGGDMTAFSFLNYFTHNLDQILIGKFLGSATLGYYKQAYYLMFTPLSQLNNPVKTVAESTLSILQDDFDRYRQYFRKLLTMLGMVTMPMCVFVYVCAEDIILVLLGGKWLASIPILKILAIAAFLKPVLSTTGLVMVTCGKTRKFLILNSASILFQVVALFVGLKWGVKGIAMAIAISTYCYFLPLVVFAFRNSPVTVGLFFSSIMRSVISSAAMLGGLMVFSNVLAIDRGIINIAGSLVIGVVVYFTVWALIPGGAIRLREMFSDFMFIFTRQKGYV